MTKLKKLTTAVIAIMTITTAGIITSNAAGNYHDEYFGVTFMGSGHTPNTRCREKWDATSSYIYSNPASKSSYAVYVIASNDGVAKGWENADSSHPIVNYGAAPLVRPGQSAYVKQLVKEKGYKYCNLSFYQQRELENAFCYGVWSPDSI